RFSRDWSSDVCSSDLLSELGHEPSVVGVARLYRDIASTLMIDPADRGLAAAVEAEGMRAVVVESVMSTPAAAAALAQATLEAVRSEERRVGKEWSAVR